MCTLLKSLVLFISAITCAIPNFVSGPGFRSDNGKKYVDFTLSEYTDVEVSIVDTINRKVVRHLCAGRLGANAPAPFAQNSLQQSVEWDGLNDDGINVIGIAGLGARVRADMHPLYGGMADKLMERGIQKSSNYWFGASANESENFFGLSVDSNGTLYVLGTGTVGSVISMRAYDGASGAYKKTIMPFPSGMDRAALVPYEIMFLNDGGYRYRTSTLADLAYRAGALTLNRFSGFMLPEVIDGRVLAFKYSRVNNVGLFSRVFNGALDISLNSVINNRGSLIKSPALAPLYSGPLYMTWFPDHKSVLISGIYGWVSTGGSNGWGTGYVDTFSSWRDGQVYKVDLATGKTTSIITISKDSLLASNRTGFPGVGPDAAINGVTTDDSGHIFICDRVRNCIGIYDTTGNFIKAIPQMSPDNIAVNRKTGEIYLVARRLNLPTVLKKISDWRGNSPTVMATFSFTAGAKSYLVVNQASDKPVVWLSGNLGYGLNNQGIWGVRDDGANFTLISRFQDSAYTGGTQYRDAWSGYLTRMDADAATDQVVVTNNFHGLFKVENWNNPFMSICSTSSGQKLTAAEVQIGFNGLLYTQTGYKIARYTLNHLHEPANYVAKGTNILADNISNDTYIQGAAYGGIGTKGFAVSNDGRMLFLDRRTYALYDSTGSLIKDTVLSTKLNTSAGVQFDRKGNIYAAGGRCFTSEMDVPSDFISDAIYRAATGVIAKFDLSSSLTGGFTSTTVNNAVSVYTKAGIAPFSEDPGNACICRSPRFDVDAYGRLFVPNGISGKVRVVDNANNLIMEFGEYGNSDSKGDGSRIPMFMPMAAAASDNCVYVSDDINVRIIRVRMNYMLDNCPDFTTSQTASEGFYENVNIDDYSIQVSPNPFNPASTISVMISGKSVSDRLNVTIYNLEGRVVRVLADGIYGNGLHKFIWNGRDDVNIPMSAGVYICKVTQKSRVVAARMILAK
ncbi:MAG: T9SS type A sorting domain-containing protein [Fibrobacteres bacterium]|nr:T9SS type A sorting domain-containing protein [Fibrobacterota bacterium]